MEHNDTLIGKIAVILSGYFYFLSISTIQPYLTAISSVASIGATIFAMVFYYKQFHKIKRK